MQYVLLIYDDPGVWAKVPAEKAAPPVSGYFGTTASGMATQLVGTMVSRCSRMCRSRASKHSLNRSWS